MYSNVSKNTNSHNFFKLRLNSEKLGISVKNLLKQELLSILDLYQQKFNVQIEQKLLKVILTDKITISSYQKNSACLKKNDASFPLAQSPLITYSCPLGLFLAASWQQTPQMIVQELGNLMASTTNNYNQSLNCELLVEIVSSGWLNFYLDAKFIASWLGRSPANIQVLTDKHQQWIKQDIASEAETPASLFFPQYIHARCCSLLLLGAREKLISLSLDGEKTTWQINQPSSISWLDEQDNLWLNKTSERNLLEQLLSLTDFWQENHPEYYWSKLAQNLSQSISIFVAECRFLGEVKQQCPPKAIARLRLIALVRFWLEKILQEKLHVAAPQTM